MSGHTSRASSPPRCDTAGGYGLARCDARRTVGNAVEMSHEHATAPRTGSEVSPVTRVDDPLNTRVKISLDLMLPQPYDRPPGAPESTKVPCVSLAVQRDLAAPESWKLMLPRGESVAMPEIPINEYGQSKASDREVRATRKRCDVLPKAQGRWCTDPAPSVSHDRPPGHRGDSRCMISI